MRWSARAPSEEAASDGERAAERKAEERKGEKVSEEAKGKIKGRGTIATLSRCLHRGFCSTSKIAIVLPRFASY